MIKDWEKEHLGWAGPAITSASHGGRWPLSFRPLLRLAAFTETWASRGQPRGNNWPIAFLAIAEACAAGRPVEPGLWQQVMADVTWATDWEAEWGAILVATPVLLLNISPYGHRRPTIQAWGEAMGLSSFTLVRLDQYFCYLGQGGIATTPKTAIAPQPNHPPFVHPQWSDLMALVASLPGQCWPTLTLAQRWGWPSAVLALVGMLSIWEAGTGGLSCFDLADQGSHLAPSWQGYTADDLDRLADAIYRQWQSGRRVSG